MTGTVFAEDDGTFGVGKCVLYCLRCETFTAHEAGRHEETGQVLATCLDCDLESEVMSALGRHRHGIPQGARGAFRPHCWRQRPDTRWYRFCGPESRAKSAEDVVRVEEREGHPRCRVCRERCPHCRRRA